MNDYRFRRRAFLASVGGAFGLEILLRNLEASAAGGTSPPRFLMAHWPNGTVRTQFVPTGTGTSYVASPILQPFEDKGLRSDMISLFGFNHTGITNHGGSYEGGTVIATTGANSPGNRQNGGEEDDAVAGGPSWDQILLKHVPALAPRDASGAIVGPGSVNAICDARVDSFETSSRCLSYDYATRSITSSRPGGVITEHTPRLPVLSPASLYATLFSGFIPGGSADAALRALRMRKSVLDSTLRELARLNELAPASERVKIEAHTEAIRQLERDISDRIADGGIGGCVVPEEPSATIVGKTSDRVADFGTPVATEADDETHEAVGKLHMSVIRAAFQCDLIRVATFQWAPGTGHVALRGLDPNAPDVIYRYRGLGMRGSSSSFWTNPRPTTDAYIWDGVVNAHVWYSRRMADILAEFKGATDAFGGNLLDHTVIPYVTEIANPSLARSPIPALVFGGRALGMQGGQFQSVTGLHNNLWATVAQAYLGSNPLPLLSDEVFVKNDVAPIPGLWAVPAR
jgi:hypothetical protein